MPSSHEGDGPWLLCTPVQVASFSAQRSLQLRGFFPFSGSAGLMVKQVRPPFVCGGVTSLLRSLAAAIWGSVKKERRRRAINGLKKEKDTERASL